VAKDIRYTKIVALKSVNNNEVLDTLLMLFERKIDVILDHEIFIAVYSV
jgi:hypothetical protein